MEAISSIATSRTSSTVTISIVGRGTGNAMDLSGYRALSDELIVQGRDDTIQAIVVEGHGQNFCEGVDLDYLAQLQAENRLEEWIGSYSGFVDSVWHNPKIVIAKVRGAALGIGSELALMADLTYADATARFGHPEAAIGIVGPSVWPWIAGMKVSKEYLATGAVMDAVTAERHGLVNRVLAADDLDAYVNGITSDIGAMPAGTVSANKKRIAWAYRDVSRVLGDDLKYAVDFAWTRDSRKVDYQFYESVAELGFDEALRRRNENFDE